ncbi:MAG: small basic protein [Candidatus Omnitrophica bacterium CG12_big_fil_rev_8_21_14_0_65_43_15]|uniref:Small basic protein n=1 Tax=Candidatus Taenaricola geysiri TaxID=1974752 RepID=A0A2J0LG58_9BACT|nr:MAG: hypothetical protein AUJ89_02720 [Candidatus Omnitrophica bacterium CG1_02_43_210]PIR65831.1 MAG: small basic protein [Candidatus Omnitrophica bacterium CG10_big_fil_rev_8_21_14_0_10_43_8]PIV12421.1 MAG: small basic protein [Candidatus Omnitrophica bacterium CG03_land_8_20_14_0_80_43_22]PIW66825.1 MAG: small basic protein [Candidatus Omnitrophica bacterium CG12_big_fil_rev_8_21_14_0_65_43_15]PIW80424.1 MAG: small basic protein [Candidatus Omnitrophica bacterium CG_4_8_14_3_um_filter_43_
MTMHPSLRTGSGKKGHRSVLKRHERLSVLMEKEKWDETKSIFGLPKVKTLKVKVKKEKVAAPEAEAGAVEAGIAPQAGAAAPKAGAAPQASKAAAPAAKKEDKKK